MDSENSQMELPQYRCYKKVWALKIKSFSEDQNLDGSIEFTPENENYAAITLLSEYLSKHKPKVGGYYVIYEDGYKSYSPAEAFESGYSLIGEEVPSSEPINEGNPEIRQAMCELREFLGSKKSECLRHEIVLKVLDKTTFTDAEDLISEADELVDYILNGKKKEEGAQ